MAVLMKDTKSIFMMHNSLACMLFGMVGQYTVIDLRNESCVKGKIVDVDGYMNVEMEDCLFRNPRDEILPLETFFVRQRNIRYVHVPDGMSAVGLMQQALYKKPKVLKDKKKPTYKLKRANRYQNELLKELSEKQNN